MLEIAFDDLVGMHRADEVVAWASSLRYFTFLGGYSSGPMDLYEELALAVTIADRSDVVHVLGALGVLREVAVPVTSNIVGGDQSVSSYPDILQPLHCKVGGVACFIWVNTTSLSITVSESAGGVTAARVADAQTLEALFDDCGLGPKISRMTGAPNAVSRERFPASFGNQ